MNDKEIFVYPKNIYVLDVENDSLYISGFSSEAEANETAKCIGARVVNYIREEAAQIAISELEEEVKRLQASELEQQAKGIDSIIEDLKWKKSWSHGCIQQMLTSRAKRLRNQAKEAS